MRTLEHPRAGKVVVGGVRPHDQHAPMLRLADYRVRGSLPTPPDTCDYLGPAMSVLKDVEGNDALGDCVIAEDAHAIAVLTGNAGALYSYTRDQTVAEYSKIAGYVPGDPATDQGTDPVTCLNYRVKVGYADGSKDLGYLLVDATNWEEVAFAIWAFGNVKIWCGLPDSWISPFPSGDGFVWDLAPSDPRNGHCFGGYGYDSRGPKIDTWGDIGTLTKAAAAGLCVPSAGGGMATRVNLDWLSKSSQKSPSGFAWNDLIADFDTMGGTIPVPPAPPAPPAPTPAATLASAKAAVAQALAGDYPLVVRGTAVAQAQAALAGLVWPS